ncbi:MAG: hypothetical protein GX760_05695 [Erysipelothrix sp.]|nr:hypothetical protein [Erysipelothrix sp.]
MVTVDPALAILSLYALSLTRFDPSTNPAFTASASAKASEFGTPVNLSSAKYWNSSMYASTTLSPSTTTVVTPKLFVPCGAPMT